MNKLLRIALAVLACSAALSVCGCFGEYEINEGSDDSISSEGATICPYYSRYQFNSYEDLNNALTNELSEDYKTIREEQEKNGEIYTKTLAAFAANDIRLAVPQFNGSNIEFQCREAISNISLFANDIFDLPWIWYFCVVDNLDLRVVISYVNVLENPEANAAKTYYEVLSHICPDAPSPETIGQNKEVKAMYEKEIIFADGRAETAMITEFNDRSNVFVEIYRDGMLIMLLADKQLFSDEFFRAFDITEI